MALMCHKISLQNHVDSSSSSFFLFSPPFLSFFFVFSGWQQEDGASSRQPPIVPLVIPVSVPVPRSQTDPQGGWAQASLSQREWSAGQSDRKPSVIVARRRSRRNSVTESFSQVGSHQRRDLK